MVNTADFKTQTHFIKRKNPVTDHFWGLAMDIGFSAVKLFSPNAIASFPSYAVEIKNKLLNVEANESDIFYRDETGKVWAVGEVAQSMLTSDNTNDSEAVLYSRNRYFSPMFLVIARTGLALGMIPNQFGSPYANGKPHFVVQTGLPPAYLKSDTPLLKEALTGKHVFEIKVGNGKWIHFDFELAENDIRVMPQPMGTLASISTDNNGNQIPEASNFYKSNLLIFDPGFGTLDTFNIRNREINHSETFNELGMLRVLQETCDAIYKEFGTEVSVPMMQKYLGEGTIRRRDIKNRKTFFENFSHILEEQNKKICLEALAKIGSIYNDLFDHDYLVITGGTGNGAWFDIIKEYYSGMETLTIISGGQNDDLPAIFANVRGYYMFLLGYLKRIDK